LRQVRAKSASPNALAGEAKRYVCENNLRRKKMSSKYQETQRAKQVELLGRKSGVFYGGQAGAKFMGKSRSFVLNENEKNLFQPIHKEAISYFTKNNISWWGGKEPTGHVLSSQIACVNHLFLIRNNKQAVLSLLGSISNSFVDVLPITTDNHFAAYIQFESVSDFDHLNETSSTRGSNCTSIDALVYAVHKDGSRWLIPIEWKYTEFYNSQNKATEGCKTNPDKCRGETRKKRYSDLINGSKQLRSQDHTCYYFEPFYQLMRQTLWVEEIIKNRENETLKATNYIHVHVVPSGNTDLLQKKYKCSQKGMEETWRQHLNDQTKYLIVTPEKLLSKIDPNRYDELLRYLKTRYW